MVGNCIVNVTGYGVYNGFLLLRVGGLVPLSTLLDPVDFPPL